MSKYFSLIPNFFSKIPAVGNDAGQPGTIFALLSLRVSGKLSDNPLTQPSCACGIPDPMSFAGLKKKSIIQDDDRLIEVGWYMWDQERV